MLSHLLTISTLISMNSRRYDNAGVLKTHTLQTMFARKFQVANQMSSQNSLQKFKWSVSNAQIIAQPAKLLQADAKRAMMKLSTVLNLRVQVSANALLNFF